MPKRGLYEICCFQVLERQKTFPLTCSLLHPPPKPVPSRKVMAGFLLLQITKVSGGPSAQSQETEVPRSAT